jgi:alpha-tubulin suppressor-like RCC1 family protein
VKNIFSILFALVLVVSLGLVTAAPVAADPGTTYYVSTAGSDTTGNGTAGNPWRTIQYAIGQVSASNTIMVAAGEYEAFQVLEQTDISIIGAEGTTVATANQVSIGVALIDYTRVMAMVYDSENINIEGIDFDDTEVSIGWTGIDQVSAGELHTVGLKEGGTVVAVGPEYGTEDYGQCDVGGWTGIDQVSAGYWHTVGLESDDTVVAVGYSSYGQCDVGGWGNITQISAGGHHTVGLESGTTVVAVGSNHHGQCDVGGWGNITQVAAGYAHTVGLMYGGTVVAVGYNSDGQCDVEDWTDIDQVAASDYHTVGLESDGTVVAVGRNDYGQCEVGNWTGIDQVDADGYHTVGLKTDGTVVAVGRNDLGQCDVEDWTDITYVAAGWWHTVGLKTDGTVVAVGSNHYGQCGEAVDVHAGIVYVDSTGRIADLTVENIFAAGSYIETGVAILGDAGTSVVDLSGVTVENSGEGVTIWNAEANLDGCTITGMRDQGILLGWWGEVQSPASLKMQGSTISNNHYGIYICYDDSILEAHFNNIAGNDIGGLGAGDSVTVDATYNWWGDASGPYHETLNPDGIGDEVSFDGEASVDFEPWLEAEVGTAKTETVTDDTVDAKDEADTEVDVDGTATVTVAEYAENPGGPPPSGFTTMGKYMDVYVPDTTEVTEIEIRLYYTDDELTAAGIDEESLQLFWLNDDVWDVCSDSDVNTASINGYSGYIWAIITAYTTPSLEDLHGLELSDGGTTGPSQPPGGDGCFIATAAYGTDTARQLDILREFRDDVLLPNSLGAKLVSLYYKTSPPIANFISQNDVLRTVVRVGFVEPIVKILIWTHGLWSVGG